MAKGRFMQLISALLALVVALTLIPAILYFSWNMFAPDLFGLPAMTFAHAFGMFLFVGSMSLLIQMWGLRDRK